MSKCPCCVVYTIHSIEKTIIELEMDRVVLRKDFWYDYEDYKRAKIAYEGNP